MTLQDYKEKAEDWSTRAKAVLEVLNKNSLIKKLAELELQMSSPDFWNDQETAKETSQESSAIKSEIDSINIIEEGLISLKTTRELVEEDPDLLEDAIGDLEKLEKTLRALELKTYFTGEHDASNAILSFHAGAGGTDASDWAEILLRMIMRFAENQDWSVELIDRSDSEEAGIKSATIAVRGRFAYGMLKSEDGVHRLVRISPFDAEGMRHTSFAMIEVLPELAELDSSKMQIADEDLRIDTYISSGKGGQSVNTTYSAVRITHIPTNTVVTCQNERSQQQNKETAMKVLKARLFKRLEEERKEKIDDLKGDRKKVEWGSQIRSYVLHPYKMVKDHRTEVETQQVDDVLNGDIMEFIEGYLKNQVK